MRKLLWLSSGVVLGFIAAHFVNQTSEGRRFFTRLNRGLAEFNRAFSAGYHDAESVVGDAADDVEEALRSLRDKSAEG
ncbi:MAG: hypothetical protein QM606_03015 [Leucobacter sp.]